MENNEVLKILKTEFSEVDENILVEVIDKYNFIIDVLHDVKMTSDYFSNTRWDRITVFEFKCIIDDLINLRNKNGLSLLNASNIIIYAKGHIASINDLIIKIDNALYKKDNWELNYYQEFIDILFIIEFRERLSILMKSSYIGEKEKNLLSKIMNVFTNNNDDVSNYHYSLNKFISFAYIYFKINNMIENNYEDIMSFIDRVNNDIEYLNNKFNLNVINDIKELLVLFESYYNEPIIKRKIIK